MSDNEPKEPQKIVITKTISNGNSGKDLDGCYFQETDVHGEYNFYSRHGVLLEPNVRSGKAFHFNHDKIYWDVYQFRIDHRGAEGFWRNDAPGPANEQEGTFTAQSGPGAGEGEGEEAVTCVKPANAIKVKTVTGGASKDKLKKLYFVPAAGSTFELFDDNCTKLKDGLTDGTDFSFNYDSITWTITNFAINDTTASGYWKNGEKEQEGTFLAQAGLTGEEEEAAAATA